MSDKPIFDPQTVLLSQIEQSRKDRELGAEIERRKIDAIVQAYHKALQDPNFKCPTYLHAAILEAAK